MTAENNDGARTLQSVQTTMDESYAHTIHAQASEIIRALRTEGNFIQNCMQKINECNRKIQSGNKSANIIAEMNALRYALQRGKNNQSHDIRNRPKIHRIRRRRRPQQRKVRRVRIIRRLA